MKKPALHDIEISNELRPGDLGYVVYLHGKIYHEEYGFGTKFETYVAKGLSEFYEQYNPKTNRVWVCRHEGRMIGFMLLLNRGDAAQLRYFLIEPAYRGMGLGRRLMDLYIDFMKQCGFTSSYLLTTSGLPASAHLYASYGFVLTEEYKSTAFEKELYEQRYELRLG